MIGSQALAIVWAQGQTQKVLERIIVYVETALLANKDFIRARVEAHSSRWIPRWLDGLVADKIISTVTSTLAEMRDPAHPWRLELKAGVEGLIERLNSVWARTDRIFGLLKPEGYLAQPIALRHPFIFYVGHLPAIAWNHVGGGVLGRPSFKPGFDELFSRGIDPDVDDPTQCHAHPDVPDTWPALDEVRRERMIGGRHPVDLADEQRHAELVVAGQ